MLVEQEFGKRLAKLDFVVLHTRTTNECICDGPGRNKMQTGKKFGRVPLNWQSDVQLKALMQRYKKLNDTKTSFLITLHFGLQLFSFPFKLN